jgi:TPR repeat protein
MKKIESLQTRAEQGDPEAQFKLGNEYVLGKDLPVDHTEALKWYRSAAEQGDTKAQFNLGYMCRNGEGMTSDYVQAYKWYKLAAVHGNANYQKLRDLVAKRLSSDQLAEAEKLANEWRPKTWQELKVKE